MGGRIARGWWMSGRGGGILPRRRDRRGGSYDYSRTGGATPAGGAPGPVALRPPALTLRLLLPAAVRTSRKAAGCALAAGSRHSPAPERPAARACAAGRRPATRTTRSAACRSRRPGALSAGTTESTPAAPITTPSQPSALGSRAGAQRRHADEQDPQAAEKLAAGAAEAIRHRLDRLPGRHCLGRVRAVETDDRRHAGVEDHAAGDQHDGPDEPHGGRRLRQGRGSVLQPLVERRGPGRPGRGRRPRR